MEVGLVELRRLTSLFQREVIALGQVQDPRREFLSAAQSTDRGLPGSPISAAPSPEPRLRAVQLTPGNL